MNIQYQFEMEDIRRKQDAANKSKESASKMIFWGWMLLGFTAVFVILLVVLLMGSASGYYDQSFGSTTGCCSTMTIGLGIVGAIFLTFGLWRQSNIKQELEEIEREKRELRIRMAADEIRKPTA